MSERSGFVALLSEARREVDARLEAAWRRAESLHGGEGRAVRGPLVAARDLCLRGGKRLRAGLVATGYRVAGGNDLSRVWDPACAVELLQTYFLIHDDWMDGDRARRGGPAVHAALEAEGLSVGLAAAGAVLAGDYALALATETFARGLAARQDADELLRIFAAMQLDAVVGQKLDVLGDGEDIERVYQLKTGSYSVRGPLELGMALANAPAPLRRSVEAFATPLGVAFQLRDDLIGAYADERESGKPRGSDLRSGKHTLLVRLALERASATERSSIDVAFGQTSATADAVEAALLVMERCGARAGVEERIFELTARASQALLAMPLSAAERGLLSGVVAGLLDREG